jgi:transcriptional regulator with XRE-family HTH domain
VAEVKAVKKPGERYRQVFDLAKALPADAGIAACSVTARDLDSGEDASNVLLESNRADVKGTEVHYMVKGGEPGHRYEIDLGVDLSTGERIEESVEVQVEGPRPQVLEKRFPESARTMRTQVGRYAGAPTRNPNYGRKIRTFRKADGEEGAEVYYRPGKFAVVKGTEMREFTYDTAHKGSRVSAKQKAMKCAGEWCGLSKGAGVLDEDIWEKAKAAADKQEDVDDYYALVSSIYQKMGGRYSKKSEKSMAKDEDLGLSTYELDDQIRAAALNKWGVRSYVERNYPDAQVAIICVYPDAPMYGMAMPYAMGDTKKVTLRVPYEVEEGKIVLGESEEVKQVYVPIKKAVDDLRKNVAEYASDDDEFSESVEEAMADEGLSRTDVAQRTGIPVETLEQMLDGELAWDRNARLRVIEVVGLEKDEYLFKGTRTADGEFTFAYDKRLEKALEEAGENVRKMDGELILQKDADGDEIEVRCEKNCGTGEGGFQEGNTCARGGGGPGKGDGLRRYQEAFSGEERRAKELFSDADKSPYSNVAAAKVRAKRQLNRYKKAITERRSISTLDHLHEETVNVLDELASKLGKSLIFHGMRLPHSNSFFFEVNGASVQLAKAVRDTGAAKSVEVDMFGVTVEFEKDANGETCEILCEKNCGTGEGGFQEGNTCARGGGGPGKGDGLRRYQEAFSGEERRAKELFSDADKSPYSNVAAAKVRAKRQLNRYKKAITERRSISTLDHLHEETVNVLDELASKLGKSLKEDLADLRDEDPPPGLGKSVPLLKTDTSELKKAKERGIVYGVAYEPGKVDLQNEYANEDDVRKAAEDFMTNPQVRVQHGKMSKSKVVFSYVTEKGDKVLGKEWTPGTWIIGVKLDEEGKKLYKAGKITGFSMGGSKRFAAV